MPSRKKPKWGYRSIYMLGDDGIRAFKPSSVKRLAQKHRLPADIDLSVLQDRLEISANIYRNWHQNADLAPTSAESKAALEEIQHLSKQLQRRLEELDDKTAPHFWQSDEVVEKAIMNPSERTTMTALGHRIHWIPVERGHTVFYISGQDFIPTLKLIENYSSAALKRMAPDKGGRKRSASLRNWVMNIASLWEDITGKKFTFDQHQGKPISPGARFCVDALAIADPSVSPLQTRAAIRAYIAEMQPGRGRKNHTKKSP